MIDLRGKHFLRLADFSPEEITYLIEGANAVLRTKLATLITHLGLDYYNLM